MTIQIYRGGEDVEERVHDFFEKQKSKIIFPEVNEHL